MAESPGLKIQTWGTQAFGVGKDREERFPGLDRSWFPTHFAKGAKLMGHPRYGRRH